MDRVILAQMMLKGIEKPEMAAAMGMCIATFYNRLRHPKTFAIGELEKAAKKLRMTLVEMVAQAYGRTI